ncbi:unnamed protein product [Parascedosporium putredinis]|uniref:AB hydrolase-1 domain-containing protein n=1 Tax=Parascedosporium putredinis TaxID=1442378 RepID=A0A9P1MBY7_9PEZI|nr:unnamed protein product [Parascedosporium putredinis]CAI7996697.1 unnamed protein product [Parascedosporium putredinis]
MQLSSLLTVALLPLAALATPVPQDADVVSPSELFKRRTPTTCSIVRAAVNCRSGPSTKYSAKKKLSKGSSHSFVCVVSGECITLDGSTNCGWHYSLSAGCYVNGHYTSSQCTLDPQAPPPYDAEMEKGPLLLLIAGANGDATIFQQIAVPLSEHFTVVAYDRRGFSRSELQGPQNYETRLATDADDARRLIEHLSKTPAIVFGSSSGAVVALTLLIRHPSAVRALIAHEPPAVNLLAEAEALQWRTFFNDVYDVYREEGVKNGMQKFVAGVLTREEAEHLRARSSSGDAPERSAANIQYWFEHEVRQYTSADLDVGVLKNLADRLILAAGMPRATVSRIGRIKLCRRSLGWIFWNYQGAI